MSASTTLSLQILAAGALVASILLGAELLARNEPDPREESRGADPLDPW